MCKMLVGLCLVMFNDGEIEIKSIKSCVESMRISLDNNEIPNVRIIHYFSSFYCFGIHV